VEPPLDQQPQQQQDHITTTTTPLPPPNGSSSSSSNTATNKPEEEQKDNATKDDAKPAQDSSVGKAEAGGGGQTGPGTKHSKEEPKKREPEVVNSRAAAFGSAPEYKREVSVSLAWPNRCKIVYCFLPPKKQIDSPNLSLELFFF
jgi:hypothetical protein